MENYNAVWITIVAVLLTWLFTSCATTSIRDADIIAGNSSTIGRTQETVDSLDRTITDSRERVGDIIERSRKITDSISRLEYLFNCYESEVGRLLDEITKIRNQVAGETEASEKANFDPYDTSD